MKAALSKTQWLNIQGEYMSGEQSNVRIAAKYGISEASIRKRAAKEKWQKNPTKTKRELVNAHLSGVSANDSKQFDPRAAIHDSAKIDIQDLERGLENARLMLLKIRGFIEQIVLPRDVKILSEANKINIDLIRDVRGLKEPLKYAESVDLEKLTDDELLQLEALAKRIT